MYPALDAIRVLHVDDEPEFAAPAAALFEREDDRFEIETAASATEGVTRLSERAFDCVVSDSDMLGRNGLDSSNPSARSIRTSRSSSSPGRGARRSRARQSRRASPTTSRRRRKPVSTRYSRTASATRSGSIGVRGARRARSGLAVHRTVAAGCRRVQRGLRDRSAESRRRGDIGYTEEELRGETWDVFVTERSYENVDAITDALWRGREASTASTRRGSGRSSSRGRRALGRVVSYSHSASPPTGIRASRYPSIPSASHTL
jgi:DNA-binding NarL/FixJ family response regulator